MKSKIISLFVCILLISSAVLTVTGKLNDEDLVKSKNIFIDDYLFHLHYLLI